MSDYPQAQGGANENDFDDSADSWARRWSMEFEAVRKKLKKWHDDGRLVDRAFRDDRSEDFPTTAPPKRLPFFSSSMQTIRATLYGNTPTVTVDRKFADASDDVARVAGIILERTLNCDIETKGDTYADALQCALSDRLLPGLGICRVRYCLEMEEVPGTEAMVDEATGQELAPAVPPTTRKAKEYVDTDYVPWEDFLWSQEKVWGHVRWVAFAAELSKSEMRKKFGKDAAERATYRTKKLEEDGRQDVNPWQRARIWEIWHRETESVFFFEEGHKTVLRPEGLPAEDINANGSLKDPLQLDGFWPCPRPMLANVTTSGLVPTPDYFWGKDLYDEIDVVTTRINRLVQAMRVTGGYDAENLELAAIVKGGENKLYPVQKWAFLKERGGLATAVEFMPLGDIAAAISTLRDYRRELIDLVFQVTGQSDIMRGQATQAGATATEQRIKARFGSVRLQALQDDFARFASELQGLKAEIIGKRYDAGTIVEHSNARFLPMADQALVPQAIEFLKSELTDYRVEVKPESVAATDFAALLGERTEAITAVSTFISAMGGLAQQVPGSIGPMLEVLQWFVSGLRGASSIEGVLDRAIADAQRAAEAPQGEAGPSPEQMKLQAVQMKGQLDVQKEQAKLQADLTRIQAEQQADAQREVTQRQENVREAAQKAAISAMTRPPPRPGGAA